MADHLNEYFNNFHKREKEINSIKDIIEQSDEKIKNTTKPNDLDFLRFTRNIAFKSFAFNFKIS